MYFKTFGCRTNIYDTELMKQVAEGKYLIVSKEEEAEIVVVNSCTVTNSADKNLKHYLNRNRDKKIFLTGCGAHSIGEKLFEEGKVFAVFGHREKEQISNLLEREAPFIEVGELDFINSKIVTNIGDRSRAFIKIQEGCDFDCGYCIIPKVRGKARSMPEEKILEQIRILSSNGFGEFVLTGINMGSYGKDSNTSLSELLLKIFKIRGVKRVRLGSLEPSQIDEKFLSILDNPILERHLHIALQYADDRMLRIMKRRNRVKSSLALFEKLAEKGFALGTDYIVGHPGESEEIFETGFQNLQKFPLTHIHIFNYSPRDGTHSATLKQEVNGVEVKDRHKKIENLIKDKSLEFRKREREKGTPLKVLVENYKEGYYQGFDQFFNKILIKSQTDLTHQWVTINNYQVEDLNYAEW